MKTARNQQIKRLMGIMIGCLVASSAAWADPSNMNSMVVQGYIKRSGSGLSKSSVAASVCFTNAANAGSLLSGNTDFDVTTCVGGASVSGGTINIVNGVFSFSVTSPTAAQIAASGSGGALGAKVRLVIDSVPEYVTVTLSAAPVATYASLAGGVNASAISSAMIAANAVLDTKLAATGTLPSAWTVSTSSLSGTIPAASLSGTIPDANFPATLPVGSGANLTNIPAANLSGTIPAANLPALSGDVSSSAGSSSVSVNKISGTGVSFSSLTSGDFLTYNGTNIVNTATLPAASLTGTLPAISGVNLTNLNASNLASGTVPAAQLPSTMNSTTFGGAVTVSSGALTVSAAGATLGGDLTMPAAASQITQAASASGALTMATTNTQNISLSPDTTGVVAVGGSSPTVQGNSTLTLGTTANGNLKLTPNGTGSVVVGGTTPTITTASNTNLVINPNGTGALVMPGSRNRAHISLFEDFYNMVSAYAAASTTIVGNGIFTTGTSAATGAPLTGTTATGVFRITGATTVSVSSVLGLCAGNGTNGQVNATGSFASGDSWTYEIRLAISATSNNQMALLGLLPSGAITYAATAAASTAKGSYFHLLPNSTTMTPVNVNASATTGTTSTITAAAATYDRWTISYDGAGNTTFYKNGTAIGSALTANTPSATALCPGIALVTTSTAATARTFDVDYISFEQTLATSR